MTAPLDLKIQVDESVISPESSPVAVPVAPAPSPVAQQEPVALKPKKAKKTGPSDEELAKQGITRQYIDGVEYYNQNNDIYLPNGDHVGFWNGSELELAEDDSETEESE